MKKTVKIYAVISSKGLYDSYHEWVEKCFTNIDDAAEYARVVDISHEFPTAIPREVMDDLDEHFYEDYYDPAVDKFCRENGIPTAEDMSDCHLVKRTEAERAKLICLTDKLDEKYDEWCKKYLVEHYPEYTEKEYDAQIECENHKYDDWHDCEVKELELVIDDNFKI